MGATSTLRHMSTDAVGETWWSEAKQIEDELIETFALRRQFRDFMKLFSESERLRKTGGHVSSWMRACYANTIFVRRRTDGQRNEMSLVRLLDAGGMGERRRAKSGLVLEPSVYVRQRPSVPATS